MKIWIKSIIYATVSLFLLVCSFVVFPVFLFFGLIGFIFLFLKFVEFVNEIADFEIEEEKDSQR